MQGTLVSYGIVKCMIDGTIDAKTAYMLEPFYVGGGNGEPFMSQADLDATVAKYDAAGFRSRSTRSATPPCACASTRTKRAAKVNGTSGRRHRVEHIEVPSLADIPRFRQLGVIASTGDLRHARREHAGELRAAAGPGAHRTPMHSSCSTTPAPCGRSAAITPSTR